MTPLFLPALSHAMNDLTTAQLQRLLTIQRQIERLQKEKAAIMGVQPSKPAPQISKAAREKISRSVSERWKAIKAKGGKKL